MKLSRLAWIAAAVILVIVLRKKLPGLAAAPAPASSAPVSTLGVSIGDATGGLPISNTNPWILFQQ